MNIDNIIKTAAEISGKTQKEIREAYHAIAVAVTAALPQMKEGDPFGALEEGNFFTFT